jgi:hypothetical protein
VTPGKNLWHCFSCQIGGGPIDWMMKTKGVSFRHAVELLREGDALAAPRARGGRLLPAAVEFDAGDHALMDQAIRYYQERLKQTPEALAYLARRGLDDAELIERHRLGFADRTLGLRLSEKTRKAGNEIRSRLQKLGLLRESGHEHFNGSIVIPVIAPSGEITEVHGRKITEGLRAGTPYHLYVPGPHRGVWNEAALTTQRWCAMSCVRARYPASGSAMLLPTWAMRAANFSRVRTSSSSAMSAALVKRVRRCSRAAVSISAGAPPHRNAETTVLVSATTRKVGPGGRDLGVDLRFGERGLQGGELVHGGKQLLDLALLHGLAQQPLDGIGTQEPGGLGLLGEFIGQRDGDVGHDKKLLTRSRPGRRRFN